MNGVKNDSVVAKIERLYGKGDNSIGSHISFEECRPGWT